MATICLEKCEHGITATKTLQNLYLYKQAQVLYKQGHSYGTRLKIFLGGYMHKYWGATCKVFRNTSNALE